MTDLKFKRGVAGDPITDASFVMVETIRRALAPIISAFPDPRDGMTAAMTAAAIFSGAQAGALLFMGDIPPQHRKRVIDSIAHNAREGMKVGETRAARVAGEAGETVQ